MRPLSPPTDVHGLLGDVAMESDDFGTALAELDASLAYLAKFVQVGHCTIAQLALHAVQG